jgi:hypothetical protein
LERAPGSTVAPLARAEFLFGTKPGQLQAKLCVTDTLAALASHPVTFWSELIHRCELPTTGQMKPI